MKFMPRRNENYDLFDEVFNTPFFNQEAYMKTDIIQKDGNYEMKIDLPGINKDDIKVSLYNGNLTIEASQNVDNTEKDKNGNIIRQERHSGSYQRSFYVGNSVTENDISANFKDGVLTLVVKDKTSLPNDDVKCISIDE